MSRYTILHTIGSGGPGGAEKVFLQLASKIDSSRFRSLALLPDGSWLPQNLREVGVPVHLINSGPWYDFRPTVAMVRLIVREKVDLIHSHMVDQNFYGCLVGRLTGRKTIATYHGPVELELQGRGIKGRTKLWLVRRLASAVVAVSESLRQTLRERGFPARILTRIYNGINPCHFTEKPAGRLRHELGCSEEAPLVGMVGNITSCKGVDYFIGAARKVADAYPQARFVCVGTMDPTLSEPLSGLVQEAGLQNRFFFLGFREDVPEILSGLTIFVLSSLSEGFPLVVLEAMAGGKPVVVTRCGGPEEVVEDGRTGLLVQPGDRDALAEAICSLLADPSRARSMGLTAQTEVKCRFTLERMVREYEELYERLLSQE